MKMILRNWFKPSDGKTLVRFGKARLIQKSTGKIELVGGGSDCGQGVGFAVSARSDGVKFCQPGYQRFT